MCRQMGLSRNVPVWVDYTIRSLSYRSENGERAVDITNVEKLVAVFTNGDDSLGDAAAAALLLGKLKDGDGDAGDRSGCGCAVILILVIFAIVLYYFIKNG